MNQPIRVWTFLLSLCLFVTPLTSFAQETYSILRTDVVIFRDGLVQVRQNISVNETMVSVSIPLLAGSVDFLLALDQEGIPLSYEVVPQNISIITLGANRVTLEYATSELTKKDGRVWTFRAHIPFEAIVTLPEGAKVIYLSDLPSSIVASDNKTVLTLASGLWELSYILTFTPSPVTPPPSPTPSPTTTPSPNPTSSPTQTLSPSPITIGGINITTGYVAPVAAVAAITLLSLYLVKRRGMNARSSELRPEDKEVLQYLAGRGGRVLESELRQKFLLPRTSVWRQVRRLERMGYVRVVKEGMQNAVELVKKGWKPIP